MKIVFTVITGGYDNLKPIGVKNPDWRYIAIVDDLSIKPNGWKLWHIDKLVPPEGLNNVYLQRWAKTIGVIQYFKCDVIYVDGSIEIIKDITKIDGGSTPLLKKHPLRNCYISEGVACKKYGKANHNIIDKQVAHYKKLGIPEGVGLVETNIMYLPFNKKTLEMCNIWWNEILTFTHRDQLSITKAIYESGLKVNIADTYSIESLVQIYHHNGKKK